MFRDFEAIKSQSYFTTMYTRSNGTNGLIKEGNGSPLILRNYGKSVERSLNRGSVFVSRARYTGVDFFFDNSIYTCSSEIGKNRAINCQKKKEEVGKKNSLNYIMCICSLN